MPFSKTTLTAAAFAALMIAGVPATSYAMHHKDPMVGGAAMYSTKTIVQNAVNSKDHTTLVAAVTAAGLVDTLSGPGPFTVFAPTNAAFEKLPAGTVDTLVKPENKDTLTKILTYHVVSGSMSAHDIKAAIRAGHGKAVLTTVQGEPLTASIKAGKLILLNINGPARHPDFPDVPSTTELGIADAEVPIWFSIWAPAGTPKEIRETMHAKMAAIAETADMKAKMLAVNVIVPKQSLEDMRAYLVEDIRRNKEVIAKNNIKVE